MQEHNLVVHKNSYGPLSYESLKQLYVIFNNRTMRMGVRQLFT
jgi:hypothetical protein